MFKIKQDNKEYRSTYLVGLDKWRQEITTLITNSDWREDESIIEQIIKMVAITRILTNLDQTTAERLYKDLTPTTEIGEIDISLEEYDNNPAFNPYTKHKNHVSMNLNPF